MSFLYKAEQSTVSKKKKEHNIVLPIQMRQHFWIQLATLGLAINVFAYHSLDVVLTVFAITDIASGYKKVPRSLLNSLFLKANAFNLLIELFILQCSLSYVFTPF